MPKCEHGLTSKECYVCASPKHAEQAEKQEPVAWMDAALKHYQFGDEERVWYAMLRWAESKHQAREIADAHDTMSFAKAMGVSDGIRKAWE